jgi:16S rRNA (adenine1518-N6/adenine1519-N6)-dimethyltransferase
MQKLTEIRALLDARGLSPRKQFGQNFLLDHNLIRKLVDAARVGEGDVVLEVGPGTGTLTEELLARGATVLAAEVDRGLCELLRERLASWGDRFTLVEGDALNGKRAMSEAIRTAIDARRGGREFKLVSNLPYAAGTPIISILLADHPECVGQYVTIQREVGDRLRAGPGSKDYGPLAVLAQAVARVEVVANLPPECFWPRPEVHSAMVAIERRADPISGEPRRLFDFAQRLFEKRRKQLGAIIGRERAWPTGVGPEMRAEQLSPIQFVDLMATGA